MPITDYNRTCWEGVGGGAGGVSFPSNIFILLPSIATNCHPPQIVELNVLFTQALAIIHCVPCVSVFIFTWNEVLWIHGSLVRVRIRIRIRGSISQNDPDLALLVTGFQSDKKEEVFFANFLFYCLIMEPSSGSKRPRNLRILRFRIRIQNTGLSFCSWFFAIAVFERVMLLERSLPVSMASRLQLCWLTGLVQQWEYSSIDTCWHV
jgi:hypothetical protein